MNVHAQPKKILVIRNDKIGDFMLAWPSFALLKKQYPEAEITALVPQYTAPLAEQCEWIDKVLIDDKKHTFFSDIKNLSKNIRKNRYDLSISLFSETRTSLALWLAGVKLRIGPATKIAQIFINCRLRQKRSQSAKPEYEYNLDLIKYYICLNNDMPVKTPTPPYLKFPRDEIISIRENIKASFNIPAASKIIVIHPGTGGSAINLNTDQYSELARKLYAMSNVYFIITAGPGELLQANELSEKLQEINHGVHESNTGIVDFCKYINASDLFISGSTGPLHIAGAVNIPTVAFYPPKRSATALRWKTINNEDIQLVFTLNKNSKHMNTATININNCLKTILNSLKNK